MTKPLSASLAALSVLYVGLSFVCVCGAESGDRVLTADKLLGLKKELGNFQEIKSSDFKNVLKNNNVVLIIFQKRTKEGKSIYLRIWRRGGNAEGRS